MSGGYEREDASQLDQRFEGKYARADVTVPIGPTFALLGGVGYEDIEIGQRDPVLDTLRAAQPAVILEHDAGEAEFVVLIARKMPGGHIGIVAKAADDPALVAKLAKKAIAITPAD